MSWTITLEVVDCASTGTKLSGAKVEMGLVEVGVTDASGQITVTIDEFNTLPIFKVSKDDYVTGNFVFDKSLHAGTTQTVCIGNPTTIPDGQDPDVPGQSGGQEFDGGGCFIVTAATGAETSLEVTELRALRDRIRARSRLGAALIDEIYAEYESFSPPIAKELDGDAEMRGLVLACVVRPLFAWYRLAASLAFDPTDTETHRMLEGALADACSDDVPAGMIVALIETLQQEGPMPPYLPPTVADLAQRLAGDRFIPWAILDPLAHTWRVASGTGAADAEVSDWLADVPLDRLAAPADPRHVQEDLDTIADFLAFAPDRRARLGKRLSAAWPGLDDALARAGLLDPNRRRPAETCAT